jgi:molybdenum cofactor biosynthesis enzyme MoaA
MPVKTPHHPDYIQIETTIACNAECPFCPHSTLTRRPRRMEDWVWKKIIDETRGLGVTYRPFLINEPLADMRLGEIMRYIREDDTAKIELNSNGEMMKIQRAEEILDAGVDVIRFSIDGYTAETFAKSRVGLDFETTVYRTRRFIDLAKQRGGAGRIEVRMIGMKETEPEQEAFVDFWTKAGAEAKITYFYKRRSAAGTRTNAPSSATSRASTPSTSGTAPSTRATGHYSRKDGAARSSSARTARRTRTIISRGSSPPRRPPANRSFPASILSGRRR